MKKNEQVKSNYGKGWVSCWKNGVLGWWMPKHLSGFGNDYAHGGSTQIGEMSYLCKITVKPVKDKLGRYIKRKVKP